MKKVVAVFAMTMILFSCDKKDETPIEEIPSVGEMQVALYEQPDVYIEKEQYPGGPIVETLLKYNRQVFVDFDKSEVETLGYHWNDDAYVKLDLWEAGMDTAAGIPGWDLVFSYYNGKLYMGAEAMPYYVVGALSNYGEGVSIAKLVKEDMGDSFITYENMTHDLALNYSFSDDVDALGHDWKRFDMGSGTYLINDQYYIVRTSEGQLFKLKFTDFLSDEGQDGYPKFSFEKLMQ